MSKRGPPPGHHKFEEKRSQSGKSDGVADPPVESGLEELARRHFAAPHQRSGARSSHGQGTMQGNAQEGDDLASGTDAKSRAEFFVEIKARRTVPEDNQGGGQEK